VVTDASHTPPVFWTILGAVVGLTLIGLIFVLSASSWKASRQLDSSWFWFTRQTTFVALGAVGLLIGVKVPYQFWVRRGGVLLVSAVVMLMLVLIPTGLSREVNGSRRWLGSDFVAFQPSELAKLAMIMWLARLLSTRASRIRESRSTVYPALVVMSAMAVLVFKEPDLGTTVLICAVTFIMLAVAGARLDSLVAWVTPGAALAVFFAFQGYRGKRMMAFLDPWEQATRAGWQTLQSRVGIASGGIFGVGIGNGRSKWGFLPEAHTDFIYSVIGEELGLIGCLLVLGLFLAFIVAGVSAGRRARDRAGTLVAVGISSWIGLQALFNIGVAVGVLPNKGITLPFVSYGGSSLAVTLFATGILLNVARHPAVLPRRR
jgi:cell division protein FtsW